MNKLSKHLIGLLAFCVFAFTAIAQTPTPTQSTVNFEIGAGAFGLATTSNATAASDVTLQLNPGFKQTYASQMALLSDNLLAGNLQYFGPGLTGPIPDPFPATSVFASLLPYWRCSVGADRITVASNTTSHVGFLCGGGIDYRGPSGLNVTLIEVDDAHFTGAPFGNNAPAISGSINWIFGKQPAPAVAAKFGAKLKHVWIRGPWHKAY